MLKGGMKVTVHRTPYAGQIGIWVVVQQGDKLAAAKPVEMEFVPFEQGELNIKPMLTLPHNLADEFMNQLAQELANNKIKTVDQNLLEGRLLATEGHLADMRKIVFNVLAIKEE